MERRKFGNTSLEVSAVSLGCWIFGVDWWGHYTDERAVELCKFAYDQGITFFDNGDAYGNGRAETVLGEVSEDGPAGSGRDRRQVWLRLLHRSGRARAAIASGSRISRRNSCGCALERSLERLGVDVIDLYMAHNIKLPQFRDDLFAELEKVKDEGKIKVWGVSLGPAIGWREEGIKAMMEHGAKAVQTVYNLFEQNPGREFCEVARAHAAGRAGAGARQQQHPQRHSEDRHDDRRERSPQIPRSVVENLRAEEARTDSPLRQRSWHELSTSSPANGC